MSIIGTAALALMTIIVAGSALMHRYSSVCSSGLCESCGAW